jgi:type II secretory pathway pseudopilin PulG
MIQRLIKRLKESKGYTLTEMTAVVATAGVLTAVMLPVAINQVQQGRLTAAAGDVQSISGAVASLLRDTGDYPMRNSTADTIASRYAKTIIYSTQTQTTTVTADDKPEGVTTALGMTTIAEDTFDNHFFVNQFYDSSGDQQWKGPYLSSRKLDPWGKSYFVYLEGVLDAATAGTTDKKLIVGSGGPNGTWETSGTASTPSNDDIMAVLSGST